MSYSNGNSCLLTLFFIISIVFLIIGYPRGTKLTSADQLKSETALVLKAKVERSDIEVTKEAIRSVKGLKSVIFEKHYVSTYDLDGRKHALITPKLLMSGVEIQCKTVVIKRSEAPLIDAAVAEYEAAHAGETLGEYVLFMKSMLMLQIGMVLFFIGFALSIVNFFRQMKSRN